MVVQSIALPKVSGSDDELAAAPAEAVAAPVAAGRSFHARLLVPLLIAVQGAWLVVLGYGVFRVLS